MLENSARNFIKVMRCFSVEKKFISRKNNVYLVKTNKPGNKNKYLVCKEYSRPDRMPEERKMLSLLKEKGAPVPEIYGGGDHYILLEYLEGPLFADFFFWQESVSGSESNFLTGPAYQSIYSLCCWFKDFYAASRAIAGKQLIMGDVNFRNFIIRERIYGIDFEECREGKIEEDLGSLCAFGLTYWPPFTPWKMAMIGELFQIFSSEFCLDKELVKQELQRELLFLSSRRGVLQETVKLLVGNLLETSAHFV